MAHPVYIMWVAWKHHLLHEKYCFALKALPMQGSVLQSMVSTSGLAQNPLFKRILDTTQVRARVEVPPPHSSEQLLHCDQ